MGLSSFEFRQPASIVFGRGAASVTGSKVKEVGGTKALIVTDEIMVATGTISSVTRSLEDAGVPYEVYDGVNTEPSKGHVEEGLSALRAGGCDCLVAVGGGSPIDTAKAIAMLATNDGDIVTYMGQNKVRQAKLPLVCVPTTAGTGSEVTRNTIITDTAANVKMLIASPFLIPEVAIDDSLLTVSMPPKVTAATGLDALTHAIEAYVSKKANPLSDTLALSAIRRISRFLRTAYRDGNDLDARDEMMLGQLEAGLSFSNSSVALVHGMSRPIGAYFHVAHGISNAMLLPAVMEFSLSGNAQRYADVARAMGIEASGRDPAATAASGVRAVQQLCADLAIPSLTGFGLDAAKVIELAPQMAEDAIKSGSPGNNPREATVAEIVQLYTSVL